MTENEIKEATIEDAIYCAKAMACIEVCEECRFYGLCHTWCDDVYRLIVDALEEIQAYRAIGTVEDLQALKEKSVAKKPNKDEFDRFTCPDCGWIVSTEEYGGRFLPHCENCGQAIDYSE